MEILRAKRGFIYDMKAYRPERLSDGAAAIPE